MLRPLSPGRLAVAALAVLALAAHLLASSAFGGLQARVNNTVNSAASGTLLYSHSYPSGSCTSVPTGTISNAQNVSCPGAIYPATAAAARTDSITASGTVPSSGVTQTVQAASCGAVQLDNRIVAANPMLARYGTSFATTGGPMTGTGGFVTVDGANPGGYETSTLQQAQPNPGLSLGSTYGLGIWFKTTSASGGPLFGFGDSPSNVAGTNDRILYMTAAGQLNFIFNTAGGATGVTTSGPYNNGAWHFAYVTMQVVLGLISTITLYVDGTQVQSGGGLFIGLSSYQGYWHLGWSPAANGNPQQYFAGALSNFVVLNNGTAPANLAVATSQTAFDTNTASATGHWRLNDTGTTTESVSLPVIGAADPCSYVDIQWGFTNPLSCAVAPQSTTSSCTVANTKLSAFVTSGAQTVSSAAPGTTQASTITLAHDATYTGTPISSFLPGLMIYAPLTIKMAVGATPWSTSFTWTDAPGSTFLL